MDTTTGRAKDLGQVSALELVAFAEVLILCWEMLSYL